jgi:hypothetical protein
MRPNRPLSFFEAAFAKLALPAAVMLLQFAIVVLVVISMNEALKTILGIIYDIRHKNEVILFGALMAVLVPSGCVLFWGCKAILMGLEKPIRVMYRYFHYRDKKSPMRGGAESAPSAAESGMDIR